VGVVLAGAVQDFIILTISTRYDGKSLSDIASKELGKWGALLTSICVLFVIIIALSGLGIVVVNALSESTWGVFTIFMTIPIALLMGIALHTFAQNKILLVSLCGFLALIASLILGKYVSESSWGSYLFLSKNQITIAMMLYGFFASVLPVWLLLCPRDYLSSFMKIGTIGLLVIAILYVNPEIKIPAITQYIHGGGPIIPGKVFPFVFITIMCGAISGFHALVASGTTPKMILRESHARPIGYGAMLIEALVGIVALIAACNLQPGDYFAINTSVEKFETLKVFGYHIEEIPVLETQIEEKIQGRTGGAVTLAVGMAKILSSLPFLGHLLSYWYHFAILFEALFKSYAQNFLKHKTRDAGAGINGR
jgi:carbon starvation protein